MGDAAARLNADYLSAIVDRSALEVALCEQGEEFFRILTERCPHLFASVPLFVSSAQMEQMCTVIAAVEKVVALPAWRESVLPRPLAGESLKEGGVTKGVFLGYDFHLNDDGVHLIEINTNAGGAFLNNILLQSQSGVSLPGKGAALADLERVFLEMFRSEWRLERGDAPLQTVVIVDEQPQQQYLYPEFLLAQRMFKRAGFTALIADPAEIEVSREGLYCGGYKVDLIYNRLTDFSLQQHAALNSAENNNQVVMTPHPRAYALYADKNNLVRLTNADSLRAMGAADSDIAVLQAGIPLTKAVLAEDSALWRHDRKQWFFKPSSGFGGRGTYRGANVTHRVFAEIMKGGYIAQHLALPGARAVGGEVGAPEMFKSDVRCYVYEGEVQLVAARLYQGQTTNFRTVNGGFAQVRIVD